MESNKETSTISSNQTNPNSNNFNNLYPNSNISNPSSNNSNINDKENLRFIDYSSFENINLLNNGIGIEIFKAYWKDANINVILKKFQFQYLENLKLFYKLSYHKNLISIYGFSKEPNSENYVLIIEYFNGGNLRQYLKENLQNLSWDDKIRLAIDITCGLQCLHSHNIVHLSLNSQNVFVHNNRLLIGDPGLSIQISDTSLLSIPENINMLPYIEPNFITNSSYRRDKKSDIYSLGNLMYEISSGRSPFSSILYNIDLSKRLISGKREKPIIETPIEYIDLYEQCWDNDPNLRPNIDDTLSRLGRMNLFPIYNHEDNDEISSSTSKKIKKNNNLNEKSNEIHSVEILSETSTQNHLDSVILDFSGGELRERPKPRERGRKCQILPCLPKCRITFGVFLCWMCIILVIASAFLGFFLTKIIKNNKKI